MAAALAVGLLVVLAIGFVTGGAGARAQPASSAPIYLDTHYSFAERAADLVSRMTLAEKASQLPSNYAAAIPRLGVQEYAWWNEYQHGVNTLFNNLVCGSPTCVSGTAGFLGPNQGPPATSFPTNQAATMSWDPGLTYRETTAVSDEARGFLDKSLWGNGVNNLGPSKDDYGSLSFYAPNVNLMRDPRWGRNNEAFGEDPYLVGRMADAYVAGDQGEGISGRPLTSYLKTIAVAKHYALNNEEADRMTGSSDTTDANIRDYYTRQFESVIENAHVAGLMSSYNSINETPSTVDTYTLNELAQRTYGFDGYVSSDCLANTVPYAPSSIGHDWVPPGWTAVGGNGASAAWTNTTTAQSVSAPAGGEAYTLRAGTDVDCIGPEANVESIEEAIRVGVLSEGVLDNALVHMFTERMATGEFDPVGKVAWTGITKAVIESPAHTALARKQADEDIVLLKNTAVYPCTDPVDHDGDRDPAAATTTPSLCRRPDRDGAPRKRRGKKPPAAAEKPVPVRLLPANPAKLAHVVIVGDLANTVTLGGYSGNPGTQVSAVQGITDAMKARNPNATVSYDACKTSTTATSSASCSSSTLDAIKKADLVVVFGGTDTNVAAEGMDANSIAMPGNYDSMIKQVVAAGNRRMVLAIQAAWPATIYDVQKSFPAIVFSGYNGEEQGNALADVLFGKQDPSGHLNFTWFRDNSQLPPIANYGLTRAQTGGLGRTYMYFTGKPTYPFGYGLSYARFKYSHLAVHPVGSRRGSHNVSANGVLRVSFAVTNTGRTAGAAVPELYAAPTFTAPGFALPIRQLVGFQKTKVLRPGQTQHVTLTVRTSGLSRWDEQKLKEVVPAGRWRFELATAAGRTVASKTMRVFGSLRPRVKYVTVQPDQVVFTVGQTLDLTAKNPWIAPDTTAAQEQPHAPADNIVEAVNNDQSFVDLKTARVRYSSTDTQVATVTDSGLLRAVGPGVATINVTVRGVTGSTVVVVQ
jgi:beta-glucosidase-like glycosyl hydrolase